jgi:hypothetical protein
MHLATSNSLHIKNGSPCLAPTEDNLLVLYIPDKQEIQKISGRLSVLGYMPVAPENPYWQVKGLTFADPDGWRVILMNTAGIVKAV